MVIVLRVPATVVSFSVKTYRRLCNSEFFCNIVEHSITKMETNSSYIWILQWIYYTGEIIKKVRVPFRES